MKNTGLTLTIIIAILALLAGGYFVWQKEKTEPTEVNNIEETSEETPEEDSTMEEGTPTPTGSKMETGSTVDIDTELKNLDTDMGSAFERDSDSDPTHGI